MKTSLRLNFALLTICAALPAGGLFAQAPAADAPASAATTPSVSAPAKAADAEESEGAMRVRAMKNLTPEEQGKLRAARKAALQDPSVKAAEATRATDKKGYRKAMIAAMIKSDPSVEPILEKMKADRPAKKNF